MEGGVGPIERDGKRDHASPRIGAWTARGLVLVAGAGLLLWAVGGFHAAANPGAAASGLKLFEKMMPVFTHPRCVNCHGGVNPFTGDNHGGGPVEKETKRVTRADTDITYVGVCVECHTSRATVDVIEPREVWDPETGRNRMTKREEDWDGPWRLAPEAFPFVGVDSLTFCLRMRQPGPEVLLEHLRDSIDIELGFEGKRGIDERSAFGPVDPEPPPMSKAGFLEAARRWVDEGRMRCGGLVLQVDSVIVGPVMPGPIRSEVRSQAQATVVLQHDESKGSLTGKAPLKYQTVTLLPMRMPRHNLPPGRDDLRGHRSFGPF